MPTAELPTRIPYTDADPSTLLGLYHGYDQARLALAKLVTRFRTEALGDENTRDNIGSGSERAGIPTEIFDPATALPSAADLNRGAHSAALTAFLTMSEQAEELLRVLRARCPELCDDAGGPLPSPPTGWDLG
ncbi:MAG: hypothetical protein VCC19_05760 [Myxococcota bacterium]